MLPRFCTIILVFVFLLTGKTTADTGELTATFLGNEAFKITDGKVTLFTDFPYQSGTYGYMEYDEALIEPTPNSTCLFSHGHRDHFAAELVSQVECQVIGPESVLVELGSKAAIPFQETISIGEMTITAVETPHNVEHYSYRVDWRGLHFYFTGDTEEVAALRDQEPLDVLFISPWLYQTALEQDALPEAAQIVIYHHAAGQSVATCRVCEGESECTPCQVPQQGEAVAFMSHQKGLLPSDQ